MIVNSSQGHVKTEIIGNAQERCGKRNPAKLGQFFKMRNAGQVEPHILELFDDYNAPEGQRARQTAVVNNLFEKKGKGWVLCADKTMFVEAKKRHLIMDEWKHFCVAHLVQSL